MKKVLSFVLALTLVLSVCSFAAFAEGDEPMFYGYIALDHTNPDGSPEYHVDPEWGAVTNVCDVIYNGYGGHEDVIEGIAYSTATNTLTLNGFQAADKILRLSYFPESLNIEVVGNCHIGSIEAWQAGLNIIGSGSLTVNENEFYDKPICINADGTECTLCFGKDVSVTVYESGKDSACAACIERTAGGTADKHIFFDSEHNGALKEAYSMREEHVWATGYMKRYEEDGTVSLGNRIIRKSDPEGIYAGYRFVEEDGTEGIIFRKYVFVESIGGYLPDPSFSDDIYEAIYGDSMYMDEFESEDCDYSFALDEGGNTVPLENPFDYDAFVYVSVMADDDGNQYAVGSAYNPETGTFEKGAATFEPIEGLDGFYRFTPAEGVNCEDLEYVYDGDERVEITGYLISEPDTTIRVAEKVTRASDPGAVYGYTRRWIWEEDREVNIITRYLYDEALDITFEDESFDPIYVDDDNFFDTSEEWQLVRNENGNTQWISYNGYWLDRREGPVYQDSEGNRYMVERYHDGDQESTNVYTVEPIGVLEGSWFFTLTEGVDISSLTECREEVQDELMFVLTGTDGVFVYNNSGESGGFTLSGTVLSYLPEQNNHAEIQVYREGEKTPVATKVLEGTVSSYRVNGLAAGSYVVKVDKAHHIAREYPVTVSENTTLDMKICPLGDFNLDGKVNIRDVNKAYNHTMETDKVTDPYAIQCGDVAKHDNIVNIRDVNALYNHVMETVLLY